MGQAAISNLRVDGSDDGSASYERASPNWPHSPGHRVHSRRYGDHRPGVGGRPAAGALRQRGFPRDGRLRRAVIPPPAT